MPSVVQDMTLVPKEETAIVPVPKPGEVIAQLIELAKDPQIDVAKIEKLIDANERLMRIRAKIEFDAAFSAMQAELPTITERGEILVNGQLRSKYARYEDIIEVIRPILARHGFAIRHRNESGNGTLTIVGVLSHHGGHSEEDRFECPPDKTGGKADIQAIGSTRSYGQRYTTIALTGLVTKGQDNDGAPQKAAPTAPKGFEQWLADFSASADEGYPVTRRVWSETPVEFREFAQKHCADKMAEIKKRAQAVAQ